MTAGESLDTEFIPPGRTPSRTLTDPFSITFLSANMERVKNFFRNHRRGMAVTAVVAGAGYLAYTYLRQKVKEVNEATSTERNDQEKYLYSPTRQGRC